MLAGVAFRHQVLCLQLEPDVGPVFPEQVCHVFEDRLVHQRCAVFPVDDGNGHTPGTLTGNAPVAAVGDHVVHAALAPGRHPVNAVDLIQQLLADLVNGGKPLRGGTENDGLLGPPVVGVGVGDELQLQKRSQLIEPFHDFLVGVFDIETCQAFAGIFHQTALSVHVHVDRQSVLPADHEVIHTEAGSRVDCTGTGIRRDMFSHHHQRVSLGIQRVFCGDEFQVLSLNGAQDFIVCDAEFFHQLVHELRQHHQVALLCLHHCIVEPRVNGDAQVARDGPGCGGPDDDAVAFLQYAAAVFHRKLHVNRGRLHVLVFHFRFRQGRLGGRRPVDRFQALVDQAIGCHFAEDLDLAGFKIRCQGDVGVIVVTDAAQGQKALFLSLHLLERKVVADPTEFGNADFLAIISQFRDSCLDRQAVGIPAGDIVHAVAHHVVGFVDDIFEDLVQGMTQMDVAVGIGRAVVEGPGFGSFPALQHFFKQLHLSPALLELRLFLRQISAHFKPGFRHVQCALVVHFEFSFQISVCSLLFFACGRHKKSAPV